LEVSVSFQKGNTSGAVLTPEQAMEIFNDPRPAKEIADDYGASIDAVYSIRKGFTWRGITGKAYSSKDRLLPETILSIYRSKRTYEETAKFYGVKVKVVVKIKKGHTFADITNHWALMRQEESVRIDHGEKSHTTNLANEGAKAILIDPAPRSEIAEKYQTTIGVVGSIKRGQTWSAVTGKTHTKMITKKLRPETVLEIYSAVDAYKNIAEKFNILIATVSKIKNGRTYNNITGHIKRIDDMTPKETARRMIDAECIAQIDMGRDKERNDAYTEGEWNSHLSSCLRKAHTAAEKGDNEEYRRLMVQLAAMSLAAVESIVRKDNGDPCEFGG